MPVSVCDLRTGRKLAAFRDVDLLDSQLLQTDLGLKARLGSASLWQNCRFPPRTARRGYTVPLTSSSTLAWKNAPDEVVKGASVYIVNQCGSCHTLNDEGGKRGPVLNGLKQRREKAWVIAHFSDPKKFSPNSLMPAYKLPGKDLDLLTSYLLSVPR